MKAQTLWNRQGARKRRVIKGSSTLFVFFCQILPGFALGQPTTPTPPTDLVSLASPLRVSESERLRWLEDDSEARRSWVRDRLSESSRLLNRSSNKKRFEDFALNVFDRERVISSRTLKSGQTIRLIDRGINKPTDLVVESNRGQAVIYSNYQLSQNQSYTLRSFFLNASESLAVLVFVEHGSTDSWQHVVIKIPSGEVVATAFDAGSENIVWQSESSFLYEVRRVVGARERMVMSWELGNPNRVRAVASVTALLGCVPPVCAIATSADERRLLRNTGESILLPRQFAFRSFLGSQENKYYFHLVNANDRSSIVALNVVAGSVDGSAVELYSPTNEAVDQAWIESGDIFVLSHWGADQFVTVVRGTSVVARLKLPDYVSAKSGWWAQRGQTLEFNLTGLLRRSATVRYDLATSTWNEDLNKLFLKVSSVQLVFETFTCQGLDGTAIPVKTLRRGQPTAALIEAYGGFNADGYIYPSYSPMVQPFVMRGGVYVMPAVRGGNEYGQAWHHGGRLTTKTVTFDDVIATSRCMQQRYGVHPSKVILSGASNGGLTAAASALRSPRDFGLAISINGVLDMLGKERMDAKFFEGWSPEYGDSRQPPYSSYMRSYSPVEVASVAAQGGMAILPRFLIVNGRQDTRVNPAHSFKFLAALRDACATSSDPTAPQRFQMVSINNSGHWATSPSYQDVIGWQITATMHTWIFDHLGWQL